MEEVKVTYFCKLCDEELTNREWRNEGNTCKYCGDKGPLKLVKKPNN